MAAFEVLAGAMVLLVALYWYMTSTADFFAKRQIPHLPSAPFSGKSAALLLGSAWSGMVWQDIYSYAKAKGHRVIGFFTGRCPMLLVCDLDLVKMILVKDFQYVMDRGLFHDRKNEPLSAHLFNIEGNEWKTLRSKLTPTFTSSRMKSMFQLMRACTDELIAYLEDEMQKGGEVEMAEIMAKYSTDVIGTCAFGIEANSFKGKNPQFRAMGRKHFEVTPLRAFLRVIGETIPLLRRVIPVPLYYPEVSAFFTRTFNDSMRFREQNKVVRNDFLDLLIQLKNKAGETSGIDEDILPAQAFVFFAAGFETSSGATSALLMELAQHPDVQDKLRQEVDRVLEKHGGAVSFEALQDMVYMEQCIEEVMRLYPALAGLPRVVTRDYHLPGEGPKAVLPAGTKIIIPTYAIHRDPEFYHDPDRFDPDRFTEENKRSRPHYAYLPFGEGPRVCIGLRFAMMQMKTSLAMILRLYSVSPSQKSLYPLQIEPKSFVTRMKGGNCLRLSKREAVAR